MAIRARCVCGKGYRVADDKAGKRMKCPECGHVMTLPRSAGRAIAAASPAAASPVVSANQSILSSRRHRILLKWIAIPFLLVGSLELTTYFYVSVPKWKRHVNEQLVAKNEKAQRQSAGTSNGFSIADFGPNLAPVMLPDGRNATALVNNASPDRQAWKDVRAAHSNVPVPSNVLLRGLSEGWIDPVVYPADGEPMVYCALPSGDTRLITQSQLQKLAIEAQLALSRHYNGPNYLYGVLNFYWTFRVILLPVLGGLILGVGLFRWWQAGDRHRAAATYG